MVSFRTILTTAMALAVPITAAITPAEVVTNIKKLTMKSQAIQPAANSISIVNGPLIIIGQGPFPKIINDFTDIVTTATGAFSQMQGNAAVAPGPDSDSIFNAFRDFVKVHQQLLNILIGKAGLFTTVPIIGAPVAAVLRSLEAVVDSIAFNLIDTVQSRSADLQAQAESLSGTIKNAIKSYEGVNPTKRGVARSMRAARREIAAAA
jgi:hypothetical protein